MSGALMLSTHHWVKYTITPVEVVPDPEDDSAVVTWDSNPDEDPDEAYGCDLCGVSLEGNIDTLCPGPPQ